MSLKHTSASHIHCYQATRCWVQRPAWHRHWRQCEAARSTLLRRQSCRCPAWRVPFVSLVFGSCPPYHVAGCNGCQENACSLAHHPCPNTPLLHTTQAALAPRLAGYPARALQQMHVAHALVPAAVAHLLRAEPQLLAAAVEAFHYRDPDDVKVRLKGGGRGCGAERGCPLGAFTALSRACCPARSPCLILVPCCDLLFLPGGSAHGSLPTTRHGAGGPDLQPLPVCTAGAAGVCAAPWLPHAAALRPTGTPGLPGAVWLRRWCDSWLLH